MPSFEVTVPASDGGAWMTMVLDADHWMAAWRRALDELGEEVPDEGQVTCRICPDGSVEVFAGREGRPLRVRVLEPPAVEEEDPRDRDTVPEARPVVVRRARPRRRPVQPTDPLARVPYAAPLHGGEDTSTEQALEMLARHVPAEVAAWLRPDEDRRGWRVEAIRGPLARELPGALLRSREALPGPVDTEPGRRTFTGDGVEIRFLLPSERGIPFRVKSALWAPVRHGGVVRGLLLLLNARRRRGFVDAEIPAVRELADLLGARIGGRSAAG